MTKTAWKKPTIREAGTLERLGILHRFEMEDAERRKGWPFWPQDDEPLSLLGLS